MHECKRCGGCCRNVILFLSPRELQRSYLAWWANDPSLAEILPHIPTIFTALTGRCHGKITVGNTVRYVYGPCRFLESNRCAVYDTRPNMCRLFPFYGRQAVEMSNVYSTNPSLHRGCGFNEEPMAGLAPEQIGMALCLLEDDEIEEGTRA